MQHNDCHWRKECWHEAKTADLLHRSAEGHDVGSLEAARSMRVGLSDGLGLFDFLFMNFFHVFFEIFCVYLRIAYLAIN